MQSPTGSSEQSVDPLGYLSQLVGNYGNVARFETRKNIFTLVNEPQSVRDILHNQNFVRTRILSPVIGDGLITSDGPHWRRQRQLMLPKFQPKSIAELVTIFVEVTNRRSDHWQQLEDSESAVDLTHEFNQIALSNIGRALFGVELGGGFLAAFDLVMQQLGKMSNSNVFGSPFSWRPGDYQQFQNAMADIEKAIQSVIDSDLCPVQSGNHLLGLLKGASRGPDHCRLTRKQIRDEVITMILAGHETTATTLAWCWQAILSDPEIEQRFYAEIERVLGTRTLVAADLPRLRYTRMIVDEACRLYPPVWLIGRTAMLDQQIAGYSIPAKSVVFVSPYLLHRDETHWKNPNLFKPDRFATMRPNESVYSYVPFLGGRHMCIGKHFALTEIVAVLATLAQRCRFKRLTQGPVKPEALLTLRLKNLWVKTHYRQREWHAQDI